MEYHLCRSCDKKYEEQPHFKTSNTMVHYLKSHLGYCSEECFNKLTKRQKAGEHLFLHLYGPTRKKNHYKH